MEPLRPLGIISVGSPAAELAYPQSRNTCYVYAISG
jgi:hypothetical protein